MILTGSEGGTFSLAEHGLYARLRQNPVVMLLFRGTSLHSGFLPSVDAKIKGAWIDAECASELTKKTAAVDRVVYILYPMSSATQRTAGMSISRPLGFGNSLGFATDNPQNYCDNGGVILGSSAQRASRLGREAVAQFHNLLVMAGIQSTITPNELLRALHTNDNGTAQPISPFPFDLVADPEYVRRMRSFVRWYEENCERTCLSITRTEVQSVRERRNTGAEEPLGARIFHVMRLPNVVDHTARIDAPDDEELPVVVKVLHCQQHSSQGVVEVSIHPSPFQRFY